MTKKVAALQDVTTCRLVLMDQRFREIRCSCERTVHVNQTTLRHITVISFVNYNFDTDKMPHRHYSLCGKQILVKDGHLAIRIRIFIEKAVAPQLVKKFRTFYGCQSSLPCSQEPVTGHYSQTD